MIKRLGVGVAGAAALIGIITILARVTGFAKQLVFARSVGTNCLATAYYTANQVPNIVFEIVVGGALAGMVVPVLAGVAARSAAGPSVGAPDSTPVYDAPQVTSVSDEPMDMSEFSDMSEVRARAEAREEVGRISSALLTWVLLCLVPVSILTALIAGPVVSLFVGEDIKGCRASDIVAVSTRMLMIFAPQIPLYGIAVVLYGVLQAHRRFTGPALAPLVSSVVVISAYVAFVPLSGGVTDPGAVPRPAELALSVGTTLGVLALVATVLGPTSALRLRWRPTLRFPSGVAVRVRRLAVAGLSALLAQQVAMAVVVRLANAQGGAGALAAYNYAWAIYMVPYAVLAVPIATSAFPVLSARAEQGDRPGFAALSARTTRAVVLISGLAAGALAAVAVPVAAVFLSQARTDVTESEFALAIALFAPGLIGYGLTAHLSRVLYADGRGRAAARGMVIGWLVVIVAQTIFALTFPQGWKLGGLALGQTLGMTVGGVLLLASVLRARGAEAVRGVPRAGAAALLGGGVGFLAGAGVVSLLGATGPLESAAVAVLAGLSACVAGVLAAASVDRGDLRAVLFRGVGSGHGKEEP